MQLQSFSCVPIRYVTKYDFLLIHQKTYNLTPVHHRDKVCARDQLHEAAYSESWLKISERIKSSGASSKAVDASSAAGEANSKTYSWKTSGSGSSGRENNLICMTGSHQRSGKSGTYVEQRGQVYDYHHISTIILPFV